MLEGREGLQQMHRGSRALVPNEESAPFLGRQTERQTRYLHQPDTVIIKAGDGEPTVRLPKGLEPCSTAAGDTQ